MPIHQIDEGVWLGPLHETMATAMLPTSPFRTVINVLMMPATNPAMAMFQQSIGMRVIDHPIEDSPAHIPIERLDSVFQVIEANKPCAVSCAASIERSPLTCAYYISRKHNMSINDAYNHVIARHPETQLRLHWVAGALPA